VVYKSRRVNEYVMSYKLGLCKLDKLELIFHSLYLLHGTTVNGKGYGGYAKKRK